MYSLEGCSLNTNRQELPRGAELAAIELQVLDLTPATDAGSAPRASSTPVLIPNWMAAGRLRRAPTPACGKKFSV
jgi:hypothetical protein